jgi:hypothetical protein
MTGRIVAVLLLTTALACRREPPPAPAATATTPAPPALPARVDPPAPGSAPAPALLSIVQTQGKVWRTDATGRDAARTGALSAGERLSAGEDGGAVLRLPDGRELVLQPRTTLRVKAAAAGAVEVELERGQILSRAPALAVPSSDVALSILTPLGITRVPRDAGQARIALERGALNIGVDLGQIQFVDRAGRGVTASAQQRIEVTVGGLQLLAARASAEPAPVVLPTARGLRVYADRLPAVTLAWPDDLGEAEVQVARDADFQRPVPVARNGRQATVPAPRRGELHWRVTAGPGTDGRRLLGQARFFPDEPRSVLDLGRPQNLVDDHAPLTTVHFQGAHPALTFAFAATAGAERYRLRIYRPDALDAPLLEREVRQTRCSVEGEALSEGSYLWRAQALDAQGRELGGGRLNKLILAYDNSLSRLAIAAPRPGQRVDGELVRVAGVAPLGSRLQVNGLRVPTDEQGRFERDVPRAPVLVFRLVDGQGGESYWVRHLRPAPAP